MRIAFRMSAILGLVLALSSVAALGQELTQADRDKAMKYLESTKKGVADSAKGLSEAQLNFKAAPDRWSVAQVLEHIAASEDLLYGLITGKVMKEPAAPGRDLAKLDEGVLTMVPDRSHKVQAPEPLVPNNRFGSSAASLKHFEESRATTEAFLKSTPDLREHAMDNPPMGAKLDAYEWILLIAAHSERHTKQIEEVKADPNFPKK